MAKRGRALGLERQEVIRSLMEEHGPMTVREMSNYTGWSQQTIRTGMGWMYQQGMAEAVLRDLHSGAKRWIMNGITAKETAA